MGNEHSNNKEPTQNGKLPEMHENGSLNGVAENINSNVNGEKIIHQNAEPIPSSLSTEAPEPDFVVVDPTDNQVISEISEPTVQKEQVKKSKSEKVSLFGKMFKKKEVHPADVESTQQKESTNEDQMDVSPATEPELELDPSGEDAATNIVIEHQEEIECPHQRAETSTQTDRKIEVHISTQTSDWEDVNFEDPAEEEDSLEISDVIIAEEALEEVADVEASDNQTAEIMYKDMIVAEKWEDISDHFQISNCNPKKEGLNEPVEAEPEIEPEATQIQSITEEEMDAEENIEDNVSNLPKVVADCVELVFAAISESNDHIVSDSSQPSIDEVIMEDNCEEAGYIADMALIETTEPEPHVISPEQGEENYVCSLDEELMLVETISEVFTKEQNHTPTNQDTSVEHPIFTEILIRKESANEECKTDDKVPIEDAPEINEQDTLSTVIDNETAEKCVVCPEEEDIWILDASSNELPIGFNNSPESTPNVVTSNENEIDDEAIYDVGLETVEEIDPSLAIVSEGDEVILEAIDVLCQELESCGSTSQEPVADNDSSLEEEVLTSTYFFPQCVEQNVTLTVPEDHVEETITEENEDAIEVLSREFDAVPNNLQEDTAAKETSTEGEVTEVDISEEAVDELAEENDDEVEDNNASNLDGPVSKSFTAVVEELTVVESKCALATSDKVETVITAKKPIVENDQKSKMDSCNLMIIIETNEDAIPKQNICESDNSGDTLIEDNPETLDEPEAASAKGFLDTIVEDVVAEEAECNLVTSEKVGPQEETVENETEDSATETVNIKQEPESLSVTIQPDQAEEKTETDNRNSQPEENQEEDNAENISVMNFFKTLVTPTKTSKKETATPDAKKDQIGKVSEPPAAPKGMSIPPPPPPEPPKMEIKGDPTVKPVKPSPKEEPKATAKQPEPSKGKSAKDSLSKFFRSKPAKEKPKAAGEAEEQPVKGENEVVPQETAENVAQAVIEEQMVDGESQPAEKVDPSKTGTLEVAAKPEPPPPVQEGKNTALTLPFLSLFKPKATEPKKEAAAAPPVAAEAAQTVKIKEEPKPAAKSSEVDNKQASMGSQAGEDVANTPKKEKRNSIHQLFKFLGQKRHSTDAGVQTESVTVAQTAEKAK